MNKKSHNQYLGDGVYADTQYGQIILTTERGGPDGEMIEHRIVLEREVLKALNRYAEKKQAEGLFSV